MNPTTITSPRTPTIQLLQTTNRSSCSSPTGVVLPSPSSCCPPTPQAYAGAMPATAATESSQGLAAYADVTASEASLRRFLHGLPGVDQVGAEARAASLGTRSIKTTAKAMALDL